MKLLVIGGTVFLGRAVVEQALARDCEVTIFHRGIHNPDIFAGDVESLIGDRTQDLSVLEGRAWDAVIDTCGFEPEHVSAAGELLADAVSHYGFVSSGSAYRDWPERPVNEGSEVFDSDEREYGPLKAALEAALPGRVLHARAGVIVGPNENIGRLPWWLRRIAAGGEVLAPGPQDAPIQLIDARDLAGWMLDMAGARRGGVFNAIAALGSATWGELLGACLEAVGSDAELVWVDAGGVEAQVGEPWDLLPLWPIPLPSGPLRDVGRARGPGGVTSAYAVEDGRRHLGLAQGRRRPRRLAARGPGRRALGRTRAGAARRLAPLKQHDGGERCAPRAAACRASRRTRATRARRSLAASMVETIEAVEDRPARKFEVRSGRS
jgi:2'-hydroxyisoflavone reductase